MTDTTRRMDVVSDNDITYIGASDDSAAICEQDVCSALEFTGAPAADEVTAVVQDRLGLSRLAAVPRLRKSLILGNARTGAKFTPYNHAETGDRMLDAISRGDTIRCSAEQIGNELQRLYGFGVRYVHEHARSEVTREQTCALERYREFGRMCDRFCPDTIVSFGASRNGPEIDAAVAAEGEWARIAHAALPLVDGGAHFVTAQAAVELQIVRDMERKRFVTIDDASADFRILKDLHAYEPSCETEAIDLSVYSTARGRNYGSSSAAVQLATLRRTIDERQRLNLPFEVEWVQTARSSMLTWYLANVLEPGLRSIGRLNITVLFGFSPRLPFPRDYSAFKAVIDKARAVAEAEPSGGDRRIPPLKVSVACGAAVLPQHAAQHVRPIDVGPLAGTNAGPVERLIAYACQPDSGIDIVRVGMEDTPYFLDPSGVLLPATNLLLVQQAVRQIEMNGAEIVTDGESLRRFTEAV